MLAYLSWHRSAAGVQAAAYERALERFHRSLAHRPPSGFRGSGTFRVSELRWLEPGEGTGEGEGGRSEPGYEDWYLLDDWAAVGILEEAAVAHGHLSAHDAVASLAGAATGAIYRLVEGRARLDGAGVQVWVARAPGHDHPSLAALLGDGMDRDLGALWRRCIGLGPAPEYCLLAAEPPAGVAASRLPAGWSSRTVSREAVWTGLTRSSTDS
jgi:hypothetical protein